MINFIYRLIYKISIYFLGKGHWSLEPFNHVLCRWRILSGSENCENRRQRIGHRRSHRVLPPHKVRPEGGGERQRTLTVQQGFWRSFVAGTGTANLTFFIGRLTGLGGCLTEAGTKQGWPGGGGTAGVTGEADITGFRLSKDKESDLSPIWRTTNFSDHWRTL